MTHYWRAAPWTSPVRKGVHTLYFSPWKSVVIMEALISAHIVKVPVYHEKECNHSLLTAASRRLVGKLHQSVFGMMKDSKLTNSVMASIQPLEASTTERFDSTLPCKGNPVMTSSL
ncbi:uncharacterized protein LOC125499309 isoform X2 [Beta vulgaris subsp. vulgaris]|uniref:uncharacterized protein LOC125499309 isoform X2 n=1 Tax=Beta vulgaris subsp. vulgaris TaxID=3555 RepID=UPI002548AB8B|nr:uncharacterized protein LOC125499309 isoform X2 [Beta vulgaris subsp. vulgaris]